MALSIAIMCWCCNCSSVTWVHYRRVFQRLSTTFCSIVSSLAVPRIVENNAIGLSLPDSARIFALNLNHFTCGCYAAPDLFNLLFKLATCPDREWSGLALGMFYRRLSCLAFDSPLQNKATPLGPRHQAPSKFGYQETRNPGADRPLSC